MRHDSNALRKPWNVGAIALRGGAWGGVATPAKWPPTAKRAGVASKTPTTCQVTKPRLRGGREPLAHGLFFPGQGNRLEGGYTLLPACFRAAAGGVSLRGGSGWAVASCLLQGCGGWRESARRVGLGRGVGGCIAHSGRRARWSRLNP
jgi:hypothetical protein